MFITTTSSPSSLVQERARVIGGRCAAIVVPRHGTVPAMLDEHGAAMAYVVGPARDELRSRATALFVHAGMLTLKHGLGRAHPLVRAVCGGGRCSAVLDATIGLAGDALHLASVLEIPVRGIEASPVVFSLLEEGLPRLAAGSDRAGAAAARVSAELGDAHEVLAAMPDASVDVVIVDPMFPAERPAGPGFALLRAVACPGPDTQRLLVQARRVARRHVVLKYPKRPEIPACDARIDGKALRYLVYLARGARATSSWASG